MDFRTETIKAAKAMKVTPRELGYTPEIVYETDPRLIQILKDTFKVAEIDEGTQRDIVPEEYWEALGIKEEKYKVVEVKLSKTVYTTVKVAVKAEDYDEDENDAIWEAIGDEVYLNQDDEDDWNIDDYDEEYEEKTYDQLSRRTDLWNENEFC